MNLEFKYNNFRTGEGEPLVFQHGLAANAEQIRGLLGDTVGIDLMCFDCPGHGLSPLGEFVSSFDNYADLAIQYMDSLGLHKAIVGGLSMGAGIATNIALRYPERVKAIIIHRPAWLAESNPVSLSMLKETLPFMDEPDAKDKFQQQEFYKEIAEKLPKAAESLMGVFAPAQQKELPHVIKSMIEDRPFSDMSDLENIEVPTLIIANEDDPIHPYAMGEDIHRRIKNSTFRKVISRYIDNDLHGEQVRKIISNFVNEIAK